MRAIRRIWLADYYGGISKVTRRHNILGWGREKTMSFAVKAIDHVEVFVGDIAAATKWYEDALGLKEMGRWEPEPVMIGAGATKLALFRRKSARAPGAEPLRISEGWRRVAWLTDKAGFEEAKKHLELREIQFGEMDHGKAQSIYFSDPDGNPLEITYYI